MSKKALVILADGFEEIEAISVLDILRRGQVKVTTASLDFKLVSSARGVMVKANYLLSELPHYDFDMLILPGGGEGVENLGQNDDVERMIKRYHMEGRYIAAICAAPSLLDGYGVLDGRRATIYPGMSLANATQVDDEDVVMDGHFITSRGPGTSIAFSLALLEILKGASVAKEVSDAILA